MLTGSSWLAEKRVDLTCVLTWRTFFLGWNSTMYTLGANKQPSATVALMFTHMHMLAICTCNNAEQGFMINYSF